MSRLTRYEQETIINFNEAEAVAGVCAHNRALCRKLERWAQERPEECHLEKVARFGEAADYFVPKSWVHIYPPRQISEEQRAAMAERMKAAKLRQKAPTAQGNSDGEAAPVGNYISQPSDGEKAVQPIYIVEWYDHEGNRHERAFDSQDAARREADCLSQQFDHVAILFETEV